MKFKPLLATDLSGSLGGITASHNKGGAYFRNRAIPTNPGTVQQQAVRNAMSFLASRWVSVLTETQRAAWTTYSENVPLVDPLGEPRVVGALPMYQRSNVPRRQAGLTVIDDAPTVFNLGDFTTPGITLSAIGDTMDVAFEETDAWVDEDDAAMLVYMSRPQNVSINFFKGPYRLAGSIDGDSVAPPTSPATINAPFPFAVGNRVFAQFTVTRSDGRLASPQRLGADATT